MKKLFLTAITIGALAVTSVVAAPKFPFPQNQAYPYGLTFKGAETSKIQQHFKTWKKAWYTEAGQFYAMYGGASENANQRMPSGTARVISPNAKVELTVSEGIGYGMLLMVYMSDAQNDYQSEFDKLWKYWKCYGKGLNGNGCNSWSGQGMDWQVDNYTGSIGGGTASDAEFDAAVALIMAYKQWGNSSYLEDAKKLINWTKSNDMQSDGSVRPGSNWNDAFNPSYSHVGAFKLFQEVTNDAFWNTAATTTLNHLRLCQDKTTGLMPDWCDWNSHKGTTTNAAVGTGGGTFGDDAARTPWRIAQAYHWYGLPVAKEANEALFNWLYNSTYGYAGMILPGYNLDGTSNAGIFVSSTYSGGLGLAMTSVDDDKHYLETVYYSLINTDGKDSVRAGKGENYFAATLNILYLLTLTGNMPNFYNMTGYMPFTPDPVGAVRRPQSPVGELQPEGTGIKVCGFEHWGAYSDKLGQTVMYPDSGTTAIYLQNGTPVIATEIFIGPEPTYDANADLKYPFAGVSVSFDENQGYYNLSDLNIVRITYRSEGVMRFALLDSMTLADGNEGGEPGLYLPQVAEFTTMDIDISDNGYDEFKALSVPSWVSWPNNRSVVLSMVRGLKFDAKMAKAGYASFALSEVSLLDASGNVISSLSGINSIPETFKNKFNAYSLAQVGKQVVFNGFKNDVRLQIYSMNGEELLSKNVSGTKTFDLSSTKLGQGSYLVRVTDSDYSRCIRIQR